MEAAAEPLHATLRLNTALLLNCLDDLDDAQATRRVTPDTNSIVFLVAHLIDARHFLAKLAGAPLEPNPVAAVLGDARGIDDVGELPPLAELRPAWRAIGEHLAAVVAGLSTAQLATPIAQRFPEADGTVRGAIGFLLQHDSYHLGQVALLRRQMGLPGMRYDPRPAEAPR
jgi:uncharacterized damage-inducible protein DinB